MNTLKLTNSGTGVRLAKRIKIITQKILVLESEVRTYEGAQNADSPKVKYICEVKNLQIVNFLEERKYLTECVIGFFASDNFSVDFLMNSTNPFFPAISSLTIKANITYCKGLFKERVEALESKKIPFPSGNPRLWITEFKMDYVYSFIVSNPDNESFADVIDVIGVEIQPLVNSEKFITHIKTKELSYDDFLTSFHKALDLHKSVTAVIKDTQSGDKDFYSKSKCELVYNHVNNIGAVTTPAYIEKIIGTSISKVLNCLPYSKFAHAQSKINEENIKLK